MLVVRVHPEILAGQQLPPDLKDKGIWQRRYQEINNFEQYLTNNGIVVLKFFLNVSKAEQKKRFLERIDQPEKNWKFSAADVKERALWDDYMAAYEEMLNHTSTEWAPWHVIPADHKWFTRLAVAAVIVDALEKLNLAYPELSAEQRQSLLEAKTTLGKREIAYAVLPVSDPHQRHRRPGDDSPHAGRDRRAGGWHLGVAGGRPGLRSAQRLRAPSHRDVHRAPADSHLRPVPDRHQCHPALDPGLAVRVAGREPALAPVRRPGDRPCPARCSMPSLACIALSSPIPTKVPGCGGC